MNTEFLTREAPNVEPIPKLNKEFDYISMMPDMPRSSNGWTPEAFKAEFDRAAKEIKEYLNNELVPALLAERLPFAATTVIPENTVQRAIENVQQQLSSAVAGQIPNGSITAVKLSTDVFDRAYGGRPWVSLDTPGTEDNESKGFPVGQVWLRPRFTVENAATENWAGTGASVSVSGNDVVITGTKQTASVKASLLVSGMGQAGDRVFVLLDLKNKDAELTGVNMTINADAKTAIRDGLNVFETTLTGDAINISVDGVWPSSSLAGGSFTLGGFSVVNVGKIVRENPEAVDKKNWTAYLHDLFPITAHVSPFEVLIQVANGIWTPYGFQETPANRGGTGFAEYQQGEMLYGTPTGMKKVAVPGADAFLHFHDGVPQWKDKEQTISLLGALRITSGTYQGNGQNGRTVTLPVMPKLLYFQGSSVPMVTQHGTVDNPTVLANGGTALEECTGSTTDGYTTSYSVIAALQGSKLQFRWQYGGSKLLKNPATQLGNRSGVTYTWYAIY